MTPRTGCRGGLWSPNRKYKSYHIMNVLSFRLFSWYSSGVFVLVVVVLTLIYVIVSDGVSSLIAALFSFVITLLIPYNDSDGYDDLLVALGIKPGVCSLGDYSPNVYNLFI